MWWSYLWVAIGSALGGASMGSMAVNDRFTLVCNIVALAAVAAIAIAILPRRRVAPTE